MLKQSQKLNNMDKIPQEKIKEFNKYTKDQSLNAIDYVEYLILLNPISGYLDFLKSLDVYRSKLDPSASDFIISISPADEKGNQKIKTNFASPKLVPPDTYCVQSSAEHTHLVISQQDDGNGKWTFVVGSCIQDGSHIPQNAKLIFSKQGIKSQ